MRILRHILVLALILPLIPPVNGQIEEMINPSDLKQQTIITEPQTLRKGFFRIGTGAFFIMTDRLFDEEKNKNYALGTNAYSRIWTYNFDLQYGITDWLQVSMRVPVSNNHFFVSGKLEFPGLGHDTIISYKTSGKGLGDSDIGIWVKILQEDEIKPSFALGAFLTVPTGKKDPYNVKNDLEYDHPTGFGHYTLNLSARMKKTLYPYSVTLFASYFHNFEGEKQFFPDEDPIRFKSGYHLFISGGTGIHLNDWIALVNDINFDTFGKNTYYYDPEESSDGGWTLDYQPGIYFQIRRFRFFEIVQIPLFGKNSGADPVYSINMQYLF